MLAQSAFASVAKTCVDRSASTDPIAVSKLPKQAELGRYGEYADVEGALMMDDLIALTKPFAIFQTAIIRQGI